MPEETNTTTNTTTAAQPAKPTQPKPDKVSSQELFAMAKWVFKLYFELAPLPFVSALALAIINRLTDVGRAVIFAKALDALINTTTNPNASIQDMVPYLLAIGGYNVVTQIISNLQSYSENKLHLITAPRITQKNYDNLRTLGIQTLEQPEVNNKIMRSESTLGNLFSFVRNLIDLIAYSFRLITIIGLSIAISPIVTVLFILTVIPSLIADRYYRRKAWRLELDNTEGNRKAKTSGKYLATPAHLKEVLITNSYDFLLSKYMNFMTWFSGVKLKNRKEWGVTDGFLGIFENLVLMLGYLAVFVKLIAKQISVGDVTFQIRTLDNLQNTLFMVIGNFNNFGEFAMQLKDTYLLFNTKPAVEDGFLTMPKLPIGPEIKIQNVKFSYPNSDKFIYENLNLEIKSGEKIAIVGHNGAGKTTLVNLLCRLYKINEGKILINSLDINELKIDTWYRNMGILFQDYNTYQPLTARENIAIGNTQEPINEEKILEAATNADAIKFINEFKFGWDQVLTERFKGGIRPSTGQWQKLAIARFFYRNAPMVIFDEPTAAIDAVSEYNIFNKIYEFFKGKTVIIISHRFSTVRNADRIIVIDQGKIIEQGSHDELMKLKGKYAEAFLMQAEGYATDKIY